MYINPDNKAWRKLVSATIVVNKKFMEIKENIANKKVAVRLLLLLLPMFRFITV